MRPLATENCCGENLEGKIDTKYNAFLIEGKKQKNLTNYEKNIILQYL
jgi:hypothetical protein